MQAGTRDQGLIQAFLPKFQFASSLQLVVGTNTDWLNYNADFSRTGYQIVGLSDQLISATLFPSPVGFHGSDTGASVYLVDTWRVSKGLQFTLGVREDRDQKISHLASSPRAAFSWSPFAAGRTRISGGYSITHDAVTMQMLGLPLDQTAVNDLQPEWHACLSTRDHDVFDR